MFKKKLEQLIKSRKYYRKKHPKKYKGKKRGRKPQRLNKRFRPTMLANGETVIELLTRSKYLLSVSGEKWTDRQKTRAKILFRMFPKIKEAYTLICSLRSVFSNKSINRGTAKVKLHEWYQKVLACTLREVKAATRCAGFIFLPSYCVINTPAIFRSELRRCCTLLTTCISLAIPRMARY